MQLTLRAPVPVAGAFGVSAHGLAARGLGEAVARRSLPPPGLLPLPGPENPAEARARKLMSRAALLGALGMRGALADAGFREGCEEVGAFFGVGASGAEVSEVDALVRASVVDGAFSLDRFGREGLFAVNPLFAFQIMNNFTLCHGAILEGVAGPNAAFFSRGGGTLVALLEALSSIEEGTTSRALAGGADSALHPVTRAELAREGFLSRGLCPAEGAAVIALAEEAEAPLAFVEKCALFTVPRSPSERGPGEAACLPDAALGEAARAAIDEAACGLPCDLVVLAPWGEPARGALASAAARLPGAEILDATTSLGEALAATPALAWLCALDLLALGKARRALVASAGPDGDLGVVVFSREAPR